MNGKRFILLFLCSVVIFTATLFYFQNYAYYDSIDIRQNILLGKKRYKISYYQGIDSESSGLKIHINCSCFLFWYIFFLLYFRTLTNFFIVENYFQVFERVYLSFQSSCFAHYVRKKPLL